MMIRDAMRAQGEALFPVRGYVPLLLLPPALFALQSSNWMELAYGDAVDDGFDLFCIGLGLLGVALRVATVGFVGRRSSGRNTRKGQVARELNTSGLYSVVQHPLYAANAMLFAGLLLATGSLWLAGLGLLACFLHYERLAHAEEGFLLERFGERYRAWAAHTPVFRPRPSLWRPPERRFCWRTALKREYPTLAGTLLAFALLDHAGDALAGERLDHELDATLLAALALAVYLPARYAHKRARWLSVPGR